MAATTNSDDLLGTWWRVPESDEPGLSVFQKDGTSLPPARGRYGFTLAPSGKATLHSPGPDDKRQDTTSSWSLDSQGLLKVAGATDANGALAQVSPGHFAIQR